jgi:hypothetical protein
VQKLRIATGLPLLARRDRKWVLNDGQRPATRVVCVALSTGVPSCAVHPVGLVKLPYNALSVG